MLTVTIWPIDMLKGNILFGGATSGEEGGVRLCSMPTSFVLKSALNGSETIEAQGDGESSPELSHDPPELRLMVSNRESLLSESEKPVMDSESRSMERSLLGKRNLFQGFAGSFIFASHGSVLRSLSISRHCCKQRKRDRNSKQMHV